MKIISYFLLSIFMCLFACSSKKSELREIPAAEPVKKEFKSDTVAGTKLLPDSTQPQQTANAEEAGEVYVSPDQNYFQSITFSNVSKLYAEATASGKILEALPIRTPIEILDFSMVELPPNPAFRKINEAYARAGGETSEADKNLIWQYEHRQTKFAPWYYVKVNGKTGYLQGKDVVRHVFKSKQPGVEYLVLFDSSAVNPKGKVMVFKYDWNKKAVLDSVGFGNFYEGDYYVQQVKNSTFKGLVMMIRISHHMDFCGGGLVNAFITDAKNKLFLFPLAYEGGGEMGDYEEVTLYFPIKNKNGSVKLMANAGPERKGALTDYEDPEIPYPANLGIPIEDLVVLKEAYGESYKDADGQPILKKDQTPKMRSETTETEYYKWNGQKLVKVKKSMLVNQH